MKPLVTEVTQPTESFEQNWSISAELDKLQFTDIFNLDEVQQIQDAFAKATGVASIITDIEGRPITKSSNFCRLCENIIRNTATGLKNCMHSDAVLGRSNPGGPIMQPCLSGGLWDGGTSIYLGDRHIANWLIGQILTDDVDEERFVTYAKEIGADEAEFRAAMAEVTRMPLEQFKQVGQALFLIAQQLSKLALQSALQAREIAARRQVEAERARLVAQQNVILSNVAVGITLVVDQKFVWVNQSMAEISGYTAAELTGVSTEIIYPAYEDYVRVGQEADPLLIQGQRYYSEQQFKRKDGSLFWCAFTGKAITPEDMSQGSIWLFQDVTAQKRALGEHERLQQEVIEAQQHAIAELSTPVIPIMDRIIVLPLIGSIDSLRARDITRSLLSGITQHRAKVVILDVTGVSLMDTGIVNHLNKTIQAARLKGAQTIVTGMSDAVAEAIVDLGIDWSGVETLSDLQTGLMVALNSLGIKLSK